MFEPLAQSPSTAHPDDDAFRNLVQVHERAVRLHCYRMLGSLQDAEDQTQETLLRAWRNLDTFEGRASVRAWLYRIATNACLDELERRKRRLLPHMLGSASQAFLPTGGLIDDTPWLEPFPDAWLEVPDAEPGPEARYETRESIELAFVAALQRLGPRQRAVLLLRDVIGWSARDVAGLLDVSVQAANSSLQRARANLNPEATSVLARLTPEEERRLVERYVAAWEQGDVQAFAALLAEDVVLSMPPLAEWYLGQSATTDFFRWATSPGNGGPFRLVVTRANGAIAFGVYGAGPSGPRSTAFLISLLTTDAQRIKAITSFMDPRLFPFFDLPPVLAGEMHSSGEEESQR